MRMIMAVIVVLVIGVNPHWQKYKAEKIAALKRKDRHTTEVALIGCRHRT